MLNSTVPSRQFTRLALILTIAAGLAFAGGPFSAIEVAAQDDGTRRVCSDHTLRGDYGLLASGIRQLPPFLGGGSEYFNAVAMWTFHGDGTFTQQSGAALHGQVIPSPGVTENQIPGTYTVNPNCTGTMALFVPELPFPIGYAIVIVDNAREIKGIVRSGLSVTTISLTRK
jgi:hypothetical protein